MTKYSVSGPPPTFSQSSASVYTASATYQVSLTAVTYQIQILKIERKGIREIGSTTPHSQYSLTQYIGTTVSGGVGALTPSPMRADANPAFATSRYGTATDAFNGGINITHTGLTLTGGTNQVLRSEDIAPDAGADYQFPGDYIMDPGSTFLVAGTAVNGTSATFGAGYFGFETVVIYFEELHLARSV